MTLDCVQYRVVLRLTSPLQVRAGRPAGLERTRLYAPGRMLWAALTETITEEAYPHYSRSNYQTVGRKLGGGTADRFSSLFLSCDGRTRILPRMTPSGLVWFEESESGRQWPDSELRARVTSFEAAYDGEVILPRVRLDGTLHDVRLIGGFCMPRDLVLNRCTIDQSFLLDRILGGLRLGEGRAVGRGRVAAEGLEEVPSRPDDLQRQREPDGRALLLAAEPVSTGQHALGRVSLDTVRAWPEGGSDLGPVDEATEQTRICWEAGTVMAE